MQMAASATDHAASNGTNGHVSKMDFTVSTNQKSFRILGSPNVSELPQYHRQRADLNCQNSPQHQSGDHHPQCRSPSLNSRRCRPSSSQRTQSLQSLVHYANCRAAESPARFRRRNNRVQGRLRAASDARAGQAACAKQSRTRRID